MAKIPIQLGKTTIRRDVGKIANITLKNRFFESNPVLNPEETSAIARPGLRKWLDVGNGPIRKIFSAPGVFNGDLFVVSEYDLFRITEAGAITNLGTVSSILGNRINMAATSPIGAVSEMLYISVGEALYLYTDSVLSQVTVPDDLGALDVAHINSYIIVIPSQEGENTGRFYWIEPGEITIDTLDFATAERSPDGINQVVVFSDMFWLCGAQTTEPWITTGEPLAPMERFRGILFDRGTWEGTAIQVKDSLILADSDGAVFQIQGGLKRISTPAIEEMIRKAIETEES